MKTFKKKVKEILEERMKLSHGDVANASSFLTTQAFSKFRPGLPQGQFGELLLFNFIQHFFKAAFPDIKNGGPGFC